MLGNAGGDFVNDFLALEDTCDGKPSTVVWCPSGEQLRQLAAACLTAAEVLDRKGTTT